MPSWVLAWVLPLVIQSFTPVLVQSVKNVVAWMHGKLPDSVIVMLAGALGEGVNVLQGYMTMHPLPPGASGLVTILANELLTDLTNHEQAPAVIPAPK